MTTHMPLIYSFPLFEGVAEAVADHVILAQNFTLYNTTDSRQIAFIKENLAAMHLALSLVLMVPLALEASTNGGSRRKEKKKKAEVRFKIAILGGSLIKILKEGLMHRQEYIEWDKWDIYFADERLVPFDLPDSNYGQAKREIFDKIEGPKPNVYHIDELLINDPQECADAYEKTLINNFARKDSVKLPCFDCILLGCAPDGHVASLFPNHNEQLREKLAWVIPVEDAPVGPANRITLTIPVICHANRVTFVVEGLTKAPIIRTIMERPEKGLPLLIVNESAAGKVVWFVDEDALKECYDVSKKKYKWLTLEEESA